MDKLFNHYESQPVDASSMAFAIDQLQVMEAGLRDRLLRRLRFELSDLLSEMNLTPERRTYLLHQIPHVHQLEELNDLVKEINQPSNAPGPGEAIFLALSNSGASWYLQKLTATH